MLEIREVRAPWETRVRSWGKRIVWLAAGVLLAWAWATAWQL
jgi:hypothetical protein